MTIRSFEELSPKIHDSVYVDESAQIIGEVIIGADCSVWPNTVIRGDINHITIGEGTNVQDGTIIHVTHAGDFNARGYATEIGNFVTIGHKAILHGCTIDDYSLIGMGSIIMDGVHIEQNVVVAAGALVPPGKTLESGHLYMGHPAKKARPLNAKEMDYFEYTAEYYIKLKNRHAK